MLGKLYAYGVAAAVLLVAAMSAINAIEERGQLKAERDHYRAQVATVAEGYQRQIKSQEEAYRVRDSRRSKADERSSAFKAKTKQGGDEVRAWNATPVVPAVTDSLCLKPGSCAAELPGAPQAPSRPTEAGTGDTTERRVQLNNGSLTEGIDDLRHDLAVCNGQLSGLRAWCEEVYGGCDGS